MFRPARTDPRFGGHRLRDREAGLESMHRPFRGLESTADRDRRRSLPKGADLTVLRLDPSEASLVDAVQLEPDFDTSGTFRVAADRPLARGEGRMLRLQVIHRDGSKTVVLWPLPDAALENARFRVVDPPLGLEVRLANDQAELVLDYLRRGALSEAGAAVGSVWMSAHEMLSHKRWNPLAAALGAYVLFRAGRPASEVEEWVSRLGEYNPLFPDALCLRAEVLARRQEHAAALAVLLELDAVGLPFFGEGLTMACARLAHYLRRGGDQTKWMNASRRAEALRLLTRLNWQGAHRVLGEPVLTLEGFDPLDPADMGEFQSARPDEVADAAT
jgi:hypothetical protein